MKKLSLVFAMVFAVGMVMAQNTTVVDQQGNTNDALVKQIGGASNTAQALQYGDENGVTVKQNGASNQAVADQLYGNKNEAAISQEGNSNIVNSFQGILAGYPKSGGLNMGASENVSSITQIGTGNNVYDFYQLGNKNTGTVDSRGNANRVEFQQGFTSWDGGSAVYSNNNTGTVKQYLSNNFAGLWQWGDNNESTIDQSGNWNNSAVSQGYTYAGVGVPVVLNAKDNISNVIQNGNGNDVRFMQLGNTNILRLVQNGDNNIVGGLPGTGLTTYFQQYGSDNKFAGIYRSNNDLSFEVTFSAEQNNGATLDQTSRQTGSYNEIGLVQGAGDNAKIQQDIFNNEAVLWQGGGGQNATIIQNGSSNISNVLQQNN